MFSRTRTLRLRESRRQRCLRLMVEGLEARTAPTANIFSDVATESALPRRYHRGGQQQLRR